MQHSCPNAPSNGAVSFKSLIRLGRYFILSTQDPVPYSLLTTVSRTYPRLNERRLGPDVSNSIWSLHFPLAGFSGKMQKRQERKSRSEESSPVLVLSL